MIVNIADLKPGMTLAADVHGANGRRLLPKGVVLEEQHLRVFNIWGVTQADIEEQAESDAPDKDKDILEAATAHADILFGHADMTSGPMAFLKETCIKEYMNTLTEKGKLPNPPANPTESEQLPDTPLHDSVVEFLKTETELGAFPDVYFKIMKALDDPLSTANSLADIISKEPAISARLLSLVNSPLYGFGKPIDSLQRAVSIVGTKNLSQLALGVTVIEKFTSRSIEHFSMADFWEHSLACGVFNRILASQIPGTSQDFCFVAGLLHDIGRLVMLQLAPDDMSRAYDISKTMASPLHETERQYFGFNHCDVAEELFEAWNFPMDLGLAASRHHESHNGETSIESAICTVGNVLALAMQYGSNGHDYVPTITDETWDALGLPPSALATTIGKAKRQIHDILTVFVG